MADQTPAIPLPPEPDYAALADQFAQIQGRLLRDPERTYRAHADLVAAALRELLSGRRSGFCTNRERTDELNGHAVLERLRAERAEAEARRDRAIADAIRVELAGRYAANLREWCNDRTVSAKLRREGVELAAQWLESVARVAARRSGNAGACRG